MQQTSCEKLKILGSHSEDLPQSTDYKPYFQPPYQITEHSRKLSKAINKILIINKNIF